MCTYRKVGTFTRITGFGRRSKVAAKIGGNVASYICTPDGKVVHAIPGNVVGPLLAREVSWAQELYVTARFITRAAPSALPHLLRAAHEERARVGSLQLDCRIQLHSPSFTTTAELRPQAISQLVMTAELRPTREVRIAQREAVVATLGTPGRRSLGGLVLIDKGLSSVFPYLAQHAGKDLSQVFTYVWTRIVGEAVSDAPVRTVTQRGCRRR